MGAWLFRRSRGHPSGDKETFADSACSVLPTWLLGSQAPGFVGAARRDVPGLTSRQPVEGTGHLNPAGSAPGDLEATLPLSALVQVSVCSFAKETARIASARSVRVLVPLSLGSARCQLTFASFSAGGSPLLLPGLQPALFRGRAPAAAFHAGT